MNSGLIKFLGGVAVAGLIATGGSAFTAGGVAKTANPLSGFIGGTIAQASTGATLSNVVYQFTNTGALQEDVTAITLTFTSSVQGRSVSAVLSKTGAPTGDVPVGCTVVAGGGFDYLTATCTPGSPFADLQSLAVSVA